MISQATAIRGYPQAQGAGSGSVDVINKARGIRRRAMNDIGQTSIHHGGDLTQAERRFGRPDAGWLDLSTGINADPYPLTDVNPITLYRLPQSAAMERLLAAARRCYRIPDGAAIVAGPGSQALMQWLPTLAGFRPVAVLGPTYSEHVRTWMAAGHRVVEVLDLADASAAEVVVLVNPNNPDGRAFDPAELIGLARARAKQGGFLVVDEAFADVSPDASVIPHLKDQPVVTLRSFGKFFGLAGLRLGFAVGAPDLIAGLERKLGPWAVSGPAVEIGARALGDTAWIDATRIKLRERRERLDDALAETGLRILGGTDLFRLVAHDRAQEIFRLLAEAGVFVRAFPDRGTWLRFGVPGTASDLSRLRRALSSAMAA
jgi:cobalamin biosynthetic protein CobC